MSLPPQLVFPSGVPWAVNKHYPQRTDQDENVGESQTH